MEEPTLAEALAVLVRTIQRAEAGGHAVLAAEAGVLLGYLLGAHRLPGALQRALLAAEVLEKAATGHDPSALRAPTYGGSQ